MHQVRRDNEVLDSSPTVDLLTWRAVMGQAVVPLEISEYGNEPFSGRFRQACVDAVGLFDMETAAHVVRRPAALIDEDQPRFYKMSLQLSGQVRLEQDGRIAVLHPGDLAIYDTHRTYTLTFPESSRAMVMIFPQELVELTPDEVSRVTAVRFPGDRGFGRMINPFFAELSRNLDQLGGTYASRLVFSALDLMVTTLSEELHRQDEGGAQGVLAREIRQYILRHLADESLTPSAIAAAHFVSLRYLYTLFSEGGETVSAWIRSQRLMRIRRDLTDPLYADKPVSWIAGRWGLHDAAHFSRLFKAEHGESPSAYRRRHLNVTSELAAAAA